jgi:hypothetical protein
VRAASGKPRPTVSHVGMLCISAAANRCVHRQPMSAWPTGSRFGANV